MYAFRPVRIYSKNVRKLIKKNLCRAHQDFSTILLRTTSTLYSNIPINNITVNNDEKSYLKANRTIGTLDIKSETNEMFSNIRDSQLQYFSQAWTSSSIDIFKDGGCIQAEPLEPPLSLVQTPIECIPLIPSSRDVLKLNLGVKNLTPFQWVTMSCYLGQRDLLLIGRPGSGKSLGSVIAIIELVTRRAFQLNVTNLKRVDPLRQRHSMSQIYNFPLYTEGVKDSNVLDPPHLTNDLLLFTNNRIMAIVVCSTCESVTSMVKNCNKLLSKHPCNLRCGSVIKGLSDFRDFEKLCKSDQPHILFGTLGGLLHHIQHTKGLQKKLNKTELLVIDEISLLFLNSNDIDKLRILRRQLSSHHQSIFLSSINNETIKRLSFRMLRTNFMLVNCVENFNLKCRFDFERWIYQQPNNDSICVTSNLSSNEATKCKEHKNKNTIVCVENPNLIRIKNGHDIDIHPNLLAGFISDSTRKKKPFPLNEIYDAQISKYHKHVSLLDHSLPKDSSFRNEMGDLNIKQNNITPIIHSLPTYALPHTTYESTCDLNTVHNITHKTFLTTISSDSNNLKCPDNYTEREMWITRTSETALRSSACPTPFNINIYFYMYNPELLVPTLYQLIQLHFYKLNTVLHNDDKQTFQQCHKTQSDSNKLSKTNKIIVVFPTSRTVQFFSVLFNKYLKIQESIMIENHMGPSPIFLSCHARLTLDQRNAIIRTFLRNDSAILFSTSCIAAGIHDANTLIMIGCTHSPCDFIRCTGALTKKNNISPGSAILLSSPFELGYIDQLIQYRVPVEPMPEFMIQFITHPLPLNVQKALQPSHKVDTQINQEMDSIVSNVITNDINHSHTEIKLTRHNDLLTNPVEYFYNNPSAFPLTSYTLPRITTHALPLIWYQDFQMLAICQLMYRSLLGFYILREKFFKIQRNQVPLFLNNQLKSAGLMYPPSVSYPYAAKLGITKCPDLRCGLVSLPKLELLTMNLHE